MDGPALGEGLAVKVSPSGPLRAAPRRRKNRRHKNTSDTGDSRASAHGAGASPSDGTNSAVARHLPLTAPPGVAPGGSPGSRLANVAGGTA